MSTRIKYTLELTQEEADRVREVCWNKFSDPLANIYRALHDVGHEYATFGGDADYKLWLTAAEANALWGAMQFDDVGNALAEVL
jgi:hypothetical protein